MRKSDSLNRMMMDCSNTLLSCDPSLIDFFIKLSFRSTVAYELQEVVECLSNVESWFRTLLKSDITIPDNFDHAFFCKGLDIIIEFEHHICVAKILILLYNYGEIFGNEMRRAVFGNLLMQKYFFQLFLHWDPGIRSTFHQLIVFKSLKNKRKQIRELPAKSPNFSCELFPPFFHPHSYTFLV